MTMTRLRLAAVLLASFGSTMALAGEADVIKATARKTGVTWAFDVTIKSLDTGWDRYADSFEVLSPDGKVLGTRVLLHPHDDEQPFTRDIDSVAVPAGVTSVVIRAHTKTAGYDGATLKLDLPH